ncbi:MAG: GTP-binding protein [Bacteriovoracia bacterium]
MSQIISLYQYKKPVLELTLVQGLTDHDRSEVASALADRTGVLHIDARSLLPPRRPKKPHVPRATRGTGQDDPPDEEDCPDCACADKVFEFLRKIETDAKDARAAIIDLPALIDTRHVVEDILDAGYRIDSIITVIDSRQFWNDVYSQEVLEEGGMKDDVNELLVEQIEYCDQILLNQASRMLDWELLGIERGLRRLQPRARIHFSASTKTLPDDLLGQHLFDAEQTERGSTWRHTLEDPEALVPSIHFRATRPFHPERLAKLIEKWPTDIFRTFGTIWIANHNEVAVNFSQIGPNSIHLTDDGPWLASMDSEDAMAAQEAHPELARHWDKRHGDRHSEVVFICDQSAPIDWIRRMESALLNDVEMKMNWTSAWADPFAYLKNLG